MRKIALICTLFFSTLFGVNTYAQLNITGAVEKKPEKIMTMQMTYSYLYKLGDGSYEYWAKTDNRFDRNYTSLFLGVSPETVIKTLNDLKYLMDNEVALVNVQQDDGDVTLTYASQLGAKMLWIKQAGQGGRSWISLQMVEKLLEYFGELQEKKEQGGDESQLE